jgi:hypothetical protein
MATEHAEIAQHVKAWRRDCRAQPHQQVVGRKHQSASAVLPGFLELEQQRAVWPQREAFLGHGRAGDVPRQPFQIASSAVDPLLAVQIDPPNLCDWLVCNGRLADGLRAITLHQPQR